MCVAPDRSKKDSACPAPVAAGGPGERQRVMLGRGSPSAGRARQEEPVASGRGALITLTCDRFRIQVDAAGLRHRHSHSATRIALVKKHSAIFSSKPSELQGSLHRQTDSASTSWITLTVLSIPFRRTRRACPARGRASSRCSSVRAQADDHRWSSAWVFRQRLRRMHMPPSTSSAAAPGAGTAKVSVWLYRPALPVEPVKVLVPLCLPAMAKRMAKV